jgi:hypothetical protein
MSEASFDHGIPQSTVSYRVAGRTYPLKSVRNCKVCKSLFRTAIENALVSGHSYEAIVRSLPPGAEITVQNIGEHYRRGDLPLEESVRRELIERSAIRLKLDPAKTASRLIDRKGLLELIVNDTIDKIGRREIEPNITDALNAVKLLEVMDVEEEDQADSSTYLQSLRRLMTLTRQTMSPIEFQAFSKKILDDPVLQSLTHPDRVPVEVDAELIEPIEIAGG